MTVLKFENCAHSGLSNALHSLSNKDVLRLGDEFVDFYYDRMKGDPERLANAYCENAIVKFEQTPHASMEIAVGKKEIPEAVLSKRKVQRIEVLSVDTVVLNGVKIVVIGRLQLENSTKLFKFSHRFHLKRVEELRFLILAEIFQFHDSNDANEESPKEMDVNTAQGDVSNPSPSFQRSEICLGWSPNFAWTRGAALINAGNSCFMNAVIQALLHAPAFNNWLKFSESNHRSQNPRCQCIICDLHRTSIRAQLQPFKPFKPTIMYDLLSQVSDQFVKGQQEDAYLYLCGLINRIHTTFLSRYNDVNITTPMDLLFNGSIVKETVCQQCQHKSSSAEPFSELVLEIENVNSLSEAVTRFFVCTSDDRVCPSTECGHTTADINTKILTLPPLLKIQIRRFVSEFDNDGNQIRRDRVVSSVTPQLRLNLADHCFTQNIDWFQ